MMQGQNLKRLIAHKMSLIMVPPGSCKEEGSGLAAAIGALTKPGNLVEVAREASKWVQTAILAVRQAGEPNPWKNATDDEIAGEILKGIDERKGKR